jgi:hypothetical protein
MAVALTPWLGGRRARFLALPFIAITPWAAAMHALPWLVPAARLPWFLGFALASWSLAGLATAAGHALMPMLDPALLAALLFANPLYPTFPGCPGRWGHGLPVGTCLAIQFESKRPRRPLPQ